MKNPLFTRSLAFGALFVLGSVSFSCNDSGSPSYDSGYKPDAPTSGAPSVNLGTGTGNALTGLGLGQDTLTAVSTATKNGESDTATPALNPSQFAATANGGSLSGNPSANGGGTGNGNSGSNGTSLSNLAKTRSAVGGGGSASGGGGSLGGGISSLGDTHTAALVDLSKSGPNGDGSMSFSDAMGKSNASDQQGSYAAGGGGNGSSGKGINPFASLFGGDKIGGDNGAAVTTTEFRRSPASLAGQGGANPNGYGPMGSQDPANYFSLLNTNDNLFKIVERRYVSKSKQWAISDAEEIRRSVNR